jgi:GNAT superfamily N-acetyltransferase
MRIELLQEISPRDHAGLRALLIDAVEHGASVGYLLSEVRSEADDYWRGVAAGLAAGTRVVLVARDREGTIVGAAQLALETRSNGRHRAEVQKMMVLHAARGRGLGGALLARLEAEAKARGRTLLFLDTSVGSAGAEDFYLKAGYRRAGGIPDYAANPGGRLEANAIFYKRL